MEIDLKKTITVLISKIWIIITATVLSGIVFCLGSIYFITPMYTSEATFYVSNMAERKSSIVTSGDVAVSKDLVETCKVIINSRTMLRKVIDETNLNYTESRIKSMISAEAVSSTEIMKISVTHSDPIEAKKICDALVTLAPNEIRRVMNAGNVQPIDYATTPISPSSPNVPKNTVIGALLGAFGAVAVILIVQMFDSRVKSEHMLINEYDLPIIGVVPPFNASERDVYKARRHRRGARK